MKKNKVTFLIFVFCFVLCTMCLVPSASSYALVSSLNLDPVKVFFLQGDYKAAIREGEKLIAQSAQNSHGLDELYYLLGVSYLKDGNYLRSSDIFEIILKEFSRSKFQDEATLGLGDTYFLRSRFEEAKAYYRRIAEKDSRARLKSAAYWRMSQCAFKLGDAQEGAGYVDKLKADYPMATELIANNDLCLLSDSDNTYYSVQTGAFSSRPRAESLKNKLTRDGYSAYIENIGTSSAVSYRVRVGKFNKRQEAVELQKKLSAQGYPTKICP